MVKRGNFIANIYLALGSNVGDRESNMKKAIKLLEKKIKIKELSLVYESKAVGYEAQANFLDMVIAASTQLDPIQLLKFTQAVEKKVGRIYRFRWGPREIDVDILLYGGLVHKDARLEIPHPRLHERDFVLRPLMDLSPELIHPVYKKSVSKLYSEIPKKSLSILGRGKKLK